VSERYRASPQQNAYVELLNGSVCDEIISEQFHLLAEAQVVILNRWRNARGSEPHLGLDMMTPASLRRSVGRDRGEGTTVTIRERIIVQQNLVRFVSGTAQLRRCGWTDFWEPATGYTKRGRSLATGSHLTRTGAHGMDL
jgi:hypothetical protein